MKRWRAVLAPALALAWVMSAAAAAPGGWFGFEMNPAALSGAPDVSALNRPLDAASRIVVRDGHFIASAPTACLERPTMRGCACSA
ncbi:hypothetical protein O9649_24195 [Achromobacter dolens]|uniref:hypothetical protein n=1 Tax=Achromobacter dolens TaxID=1287738 RepID=UPI0022B8E89E|nr:hypothetical protein [Achromobacter dolens]MCZ8410892.1 hypothetical protein [Achromobacter dolens]